MSDFDEARKIIEMWRRWKDRNGIVVATATLSAYRSSIKPYIRWMKVHRYPIATMDRKKWTRYCRFVTEVDEGSDAKKVHWLSAAAAVLRFLFDTSAIDEFSLKLPEITYVMHKNMSCKLPLIPTYKDIQELRRTPMRIEDAMLFEVALSSGLRKDEIATIRMCDISFNKRVVDITTNTKSKYCGAGVYVSTFVSSTKGKRDRSTYISPLAAKLLRLYAEINGVKLDSQIPLAVSYSRLRCANNVYNNNISWSDSLTKSAESKRTASVSEMNEDDAKEFASLPKIIQAAYTRRVVTEGNMTHKPLGRKERGNITWHSMRYFFASMMFHRAYSGQRESLRHVSKMLGHSGMVMSERYLTQFNSVASDAEWACMLVGTSSSWINVVLNRIDDRRKLFDGVYGDWHKRNVKHKS